MRFFMLKKLDSFIIKSYIGPLLATFFISVFLLLMQFLWKYIDDLVGKGLAWNVVGELLLYASAGLVPMALPLSILLASIMVFGNLGEKNELMALKSSGISLQRIMAPILGFNIIIGISAFFFANNVLPYTNLKMGALLYDVRQQRPELSIKEGVFYKGIDDITIKVRDKDKITGTLHDLMIYDHRKRDGNMNLTIADSGTMVMSDDKRYLIFTLFAGSRYEEVRSTNNYRKDKIRLPSQHETFRKERIMFEISGLDFTRSSEELFKDNYQMLNASQLAFVEDSLIQRLYIKQRNFFSRLKLTALYKYERDDSVGLQSLNIDSVYANFPINLKIAAMKEALAGARTTKSMIESNIEDYEGRMRWINKHRIEWHRKFTIAFACVLLFFIGAPFGAIVRKGGLGMPVVISVVFFIMYYVITMTGEKYVKTGEAGAFQGMWFASFILLPLGLYLTYQATYDKMSMNTGALKAIFKRISKRLPFIKKD